MLKKTLKLIEETTANLISISRQETLPQSFEVAVEVFEQVWSNITGNPEETTADEFEEVAYMDSDFFIAFQRLTLRDFCEELSGEVYDYIEAGIKKRCRRLAENDDMLKWHKFCAKFNCYEFSKFLLNYLVTKKLVKQYDREGEKTIGVYCDDFEALMIFASEHASRFIRSHIVS